jgi:hypothetical protein
MLSQSASVVTIYQPTADEVIPLMEAARNSWPKLASRIDKAQDILLSGGIGLDPLAWQLRAMPWWKIASQSKENGFYIIVGSTGCHCPDQAPKIGERSFCKHVIALACYLRILRDKFNADVRCFNVELSMLHTGELHAYAKRLGYVQVSNVNDTYHFATQASPAHYAIWLAAQQPVPTAWPIAATVTA